MAQPINKQPETSYELHNQLNQYEFMRHNKELPQLSINANALNDFLFSRNTIDKMLLKFDIDFAEETRSLNFLKNTSDLYDPLKDENLNEVLDAYLTVCECDTCFRCLTYDYPKGFFRTPISKDKQAVSCTSYVTDMLAKVYHLKPTNDKPAVSYAFNNEKNVNVPQTKTDIVTGFVLRSSLTDLICIDFDIPKDLSNDDKELIRRNILYCFYKDIMGPNEDIDWDIERLMFDVSGSGGLHVWLKCDIDDWFNSLTTDSIIGVKNVMSNYDSGDEKTNDILHNNVSVDIFFNNASRLGVNNKGEPKNDRGVLLPGSYAKPKDGAKVINYYSLPDITIDASRNPLTYKEFIARSNLITLPKTEEEFVSIAKKGNNKGNKEDDEDAKSTDGKKSFTNVIKHTFNEGDSLTKHPIEKPLLKLIVDGFDSNIEMHCDSNGKQAVEEVNTFLVATALLAAYTEDNDDEVYANFEDVSEAYEGICNKCTLTAKAAAGNAYKSQWERFVNEGTKASTWGGLLTILKTFNEEYYNNTIKPYLRAMLHGNEIPFEDDTYTIQHLKNEARSKIYESLNEAVRSIKRCVATLYDTPGFMIRAFDRTTGGSRIDIKDYAALKNTTGLPIINYNELVLKRRVGRPAKDQEDEYEVKTNKELLVDILKKPCILEQLDSFESFVTIKTSNDEILEAECNVKVYPLYRGPPVTEYDPELAKKFINIMRERVYYKRPLDFLFSTVAYKLRYPEVFSDKLFINYGKGNNGKSLLSHALLAMFGEVVGYEGSYQYMVEGKYNGWMDKKLFVTMEEGKRNEKRGRNYKMELWAKLVTSEKGDLRKMYNDPRSFTNEAIYMLNTNYNDLCGLAYSEQAFREEGDDSVRQRLVIIEWKPLDEDQKVFRSKMNEFMNKRDIITTRKFIYSLYKYLREEYEIPEDYDEGRYDGEEKYEYLNRFTDRISSPYSDVIVEDFNKPAVERVIQQSKQEGYYYATYTSIKTLLEKMLPSNTSCADIATKLGGEFCKNLYKHTGGKGTSRGIVLTEQQYIKLLGITEQEFNVATDVSGNVDGL